VVEASNERPFKRLTVENHFNVITKQAVLVSWALAPSFTQPGPYQFLLQRGHASTDDQWVDISTTTDQPWLYDHHPIFGQFEHSTFYRVVLTDGNGVKYTSQPVSMDMSWSHYDWRLMREIIRKETLVQRKRGGTKGFLLKRRAWGDPCPDCVDPNTGEIKDAHCLVCFGTGIVGGYYPADEYWVIQNPTQRLKKIMGDEGLRTVVMETVRGLAWPAPEGDDIWVQAATNKRFRIDGDVVVQARHRGVDVVLNLHLEQLPLSSIVYEVPTA
jgi:hypothetical protein